MKNMKQQLNMPSGKGGMIVTLTYKEYLLVYSMSILHR